MFSIEGLGDLQELISGRDAYKPYPKISNREEWEAIPVSMKETIIREAEGYLGYEGPLPKATQMMDFMRTGNRSDFEKRAHDQRQALLALVLAECIENEGRFIDDIINITWQFCEQTTWMLPAHYSLLNRQGIAGMLPDVQNQAIDLFAGEVGVLLAYTHYLMKSVLDQVTPAIGQRIAYELDRRIIHPFIHRRDFWWMGFSGRTVNNWAPWCVSNCLITTMLMENDASKRGEVVAKSLQIMEKFTDAYHADGGCDEGTSYWDRAGGSLFDCLEILYEWSDGKIAFYDQPLVKNIGEYIYKSHIDQNYFVNFADGNARVHLECILVYRYGKRLHSEALKRVAAMVHNTGIPVNPIESGILRGLPSIFMYNEFKTYADSLQDTAVDIKDHVLDGIQMVTYREKKTIHQGLFLAAKGGHNDESHNHNDIGQYVVYKDGTPIIIDAGCGVYTRKTFSPQRYEIWTMQSSYHNLPEVNGVPQAYGSSYRPTDVTYHVSEARSEISLDIKKAYPEESGIDSWVRNLAMEREPDGIITLEDNFQLYEGSSDIKNVMMTWYEPQIDQEAGMITVAYGDGKKAVITYDKTQLDVDVEEVITKDDTKLCSIWGDKIYRIIYKVKGAIKNGVHHYTIQ